MTTLTRESLSALANTRGEPSWLQDRRMQAGLVFNDTPSPSPNDEEWRRTDTSWIDWSNIFPSTSGSAASAEALPLSIGLPEASIILVVHGPTTTLMHMTPEAQAAGVIVDGLATAAAQDSQTIVDHLATDLVTPTSGKFQALNTALWTGGAFIYVPAGVELETPIVVLETSTGRAAYPRSLVVVEKGASADIVEWWQSDPGGSLDFANGSTELFVHSGGRLSYTHVQLWKHETSSFLSQHARVDKDASLVMSNVSLGSRFHKANVKATLAGPGANAQLNGLTYLNQQQFADHHTLQDHATTDALSDLLYVNVLDDTSRSVYAGTIVVHPEAQRSNAYQRNRNLLLRSGPRADSIPRLEIMADDVRCTHGSTTSTLDPSHLFYLNSRGLDHDSARQLVIDAAFHPIIDRIPNASIAETVRKAVRAKTNRKPRN